MITRTITRLFSRSRFIEPGFNEFGVYVCQEWLYSESRGYGGDLIDHDIQTVAIHGWLHPLSLSEEINSYEAQRYCSKSSGMATLTWYENGEYSVSYHFYFDSSSIHLINGGHISPIIWQQTGNRRIIDEAMDFQSDIDVIENPSILDDIPF